jgi:multiple sugar transport system substrate-binding protein
MSDARGQSKDPGETSQARLTRRRLLVTGATGAAAAYGLSAGGASARGLSSSIFKSTAAGTVTFGANAADTPVPLKALNQSFKAFTAKTGTQVKVNAVAHNQFQEQINSYLQGQPDDVFTWFAGYRMKFFAEKGLLSQVDDVWATLKPQFASAFQNASKGSDGHYYFVPSHAYPWALHYRKSVFAKNGYTPPKTWAQLIALCKKMQADGLTPLAFTDKEGWPAMGTFDIINMRINGYDFHVRLMGGKARWDSPQVKKVFNTWAELLPYTSEGALGMLWQEGATQFIKGEAGMYFLGTFVGQAFPAAASKDVDFVAFPAINPKWGQDSIDAPIDGYCMSKKSKNPTEAKQLMTFLGSAAYENIYLNSDPNNFGANKNVNTSKYTAIQKKSAALVAKTAHIAQFLDRDTRPDFASTVMIPAIQQFLNKPEDVNSLCSSIQKQKVAIFGS